METNRTPYPIISFSTPICFCVNCQLDWLPLEGKPFAHVTTASDQSLSWSAPVFRALHHCISTPSLSIYTMRDSYFHNMGAGYIFKVETPLSLHFHTCTSADTRTITHTIFPEALSVCWDTRSTGSKNPAWWGKSQTPRKDSVMASDGTHYGILAVSFLIFSNTSLAKHFSYIKHIKEWVSESLPLLNLVIWSLLTLGS